MLLQDYAYYVMNLLSAGVMTLTGIIGVALLLGAFVALFAMRGSQLRGTALGGLLLAGLACLATAFFTAVYEFDEQPETLSFESIPAGEPDCGYAWSGWIKSGYGITNKCPEGCYRGLTVNKQMRMRGFPPWPEHNRELQCWSR